MKIYFVEKEKSSLFLLASHNIQSLLVSFHYIEARNPWSYIPKLQDEGSFQDLMVDSGAFSAWSLGVPINLDRYMLFIEKNQSRISEYFSLDVIENPLASFNNYERMLNRGLKPIPVFHTRSDYKWLHKYCQISDYIGLGGMAGKNNSQRYLEGHLDKCFSIIKKYWPKKIHGLGLGTSLRFMLRYPFYSSDSTAWASVARFANFFKLRPGKESLGYEPKLIDLYWLKNSTPMERMEYGIGEFLKIQAYISLVWERKGIKWQ